MQALVAASWAAEKPRVGVHIGDLDWWTAHPRDVPDLVSLWYEGEELVGWAWHSPPSELDAHINRRLHGGPLYERMLDWFEGSVSERPTPPEELVAFVFEPNRGQTELLEARGYKAAGPYLVHNLRSLRGRPSEPQLPKGFTVRHVQGSGDIDLRVEVHRSAFAPSRMTPERYRRVMASSHYRRELDWVTVAPDGTFASFCNIWLDPSNRVGLLEPVGTAEGYRRMNLGRVVCLAAMAAAAREGAEAAVVLSRAGNAASLGLYRSLGFEEFGCTYRFTRTL
jgi:ribosomal protein S18 acetylase RimI-like enzyme